MIVHGRRFKLNPGPCLFQKGRMVAKQLQSARAKAWKRQRGQCYYCNASVAKHKATLDHRTPASLGGTLQDGNAVMACRRCNEEKADMPEHIFRDPAARERWREEKRMTQRMWSSPFFGEYRSEEAAQ
jgi:5-methylcytosine-specific restriction endonuclease McrA